MISLSIGGTTGGTTLSIGSSAPPVVSIGVLTIASNTSSSFIFSGVWDSELISLGGSSVDFTGAPAGVLYAISSSNVALATVGLGIVSISGSSTFSVEPNQEGSLSSSGTSTISFGGSYLYRFNPAAVLPGITLDGSNLIIPIASLPGLSNEEVDSASGSWVDIFQAVCIADHLWDKEYTPSNPLAPDTYSSWNNRNMNAKSSKFQYGVGELNTFLKHFTVNYSITKLVDEN